MVVNSQIHGLGAFECSTIIQITCQQNIGDLIFFLYNERGLFKENFSHYSELFKNTNGGDNISTKLKGKSI